MAGGGKQILRLNLDETSVRLYQGSNKGNVFVTNKVRLLQELPWWKRRCCLTHIAIICDQASIQPELPQVVVGNETAFPAAPMAQLRAQAPANIVLVRQRRAWSNNELCASLVRRLGAALAAYKDRYQPVLLLDASRIRCSWAVLAACVAAGIWPVLVPAKMTWLLQPLDTHAFQRYKACLREAYQRARIRGGHHDLSIEDFLQCVYIAVRKVLQGIHWSFAFDKDGYGSPQVELSTAVIAHLGAGARAGVPVSRPTQAALERCVPRRTQIQVSLVWRPFDAPPRTTGPPGSAAASSGSGAPAVLPSAIVGSFARRVLGRTRSGTRALAASSADAASSGAPLAAPGWASAVSSSGAPAVLPVAAAGPPPPQRQLGRTRFATRALAAASSATGSSR